MLPGGDKGFCAVDDVDILVTDRAGPDSGQITACAWFGHGHRENGLTRDRTGKPTRLLLIGGEAEQIGQDNVILQRQAKTRRRGQRATELFPDDRVEPEVLDAGPAVLVIDTESEQAPRTSVGEQRTINDACPLPRIIVRQHTLRDKVPHQLAEECMLAVIHACRQ